MNSMPNKNTMRKASAKFLLHRGETCEPPNRECSALGLNAIIQSSYNETLCLNGLISIRRISIRRIESRKLGESESGVRHIESMGRLTNGKKNGRLIS